MFGGGSGGSGNSDATRAAETGELVIGLTDARGDFVNYTVDVVSLTLTKLNGAEVNALPVTTRVDFSQYVEMTEFLTAATVPSGVYTKATLTLNYVNAAIWVENADGDAVQVENIEDEDGNPVTTISVSVHLEGKQALLIAPGIPKHLTLDFDLNASNDVDFDDSGEPTVTLKPVLLAEVDAQKPKIHRLRGPLKSVDVDAASFNVIIRPFIHIISGGDNHFGTLKVSVDDDTIFDINGQKFQGMIGLEELNKQQLLTAVVVSGDLICRSHQFKARQVNAGSSVAGGVNDVVSGSVIRRVDDVLTVKGATLIRSQGSVVFNDEIEVRLGEGTIVSRHRSMNAFDTDDISVGQRITVFGFLNEDETEMDATEGYVRMQVTVLRGNVVSTSEETQTLVIGLEAINGRRVSLFDFTGTGSDADNDADPARYLIDTANLDLSGLFAGAPIKVGGYVNSFGRSEDESDFEAATIVNVAHANGVMLVNWFPASLNAIEAPAKDGFLLNLDGTGCFHHVNRAGVKTDLTKLPYEPIIEPGDDEQGLFVIHQYGTRQLFFTFDAFIAELSLRLADGDAVRYLIAKGPFDDASVIMSTDLIVVGLN